MQNICKRSLKDSLLRFIMDNNIKKHNVYISEEEKTLIWDDVQVLLKKHLEMKYITVGFKSLR